MAEFASLPDVSYPEKEFQGILEVLRRLFVQRHPGVVTDFNSANVVTVTLEALAVLGERLALDQTAQARECFLSTAKLRTSIARHAKAFNYFPAGRVAATALLTITLLRDSAYDTLIPAGTVFTSADARPVRFRTLEDATLPAGLAGSSIEVWVENSEPFEDVFVATGEPFHRFITNRRPILLSGIQGDGTAEPNPFLVFVDAIPYTRVSSLSASEPNDTHYKASINNEGRAEVEFGDGINGIRALGEVRIQGRIGGGALGNGAVITRSPGFFNVNNEPVTVSVSNSILSSGGADEETIEESRVRIPLSIQAALSTVSLKDFIINVEGVSGIDRCLPLTSNEDPSVPENKTEILVISDSPTNAQVIGGNTAATTITSGVDDDIKLSINGEDPQTFTLGSQGSAETIAAALQAAIRAATPQFALDNADAYSGFVVEFDDTQDRYILTSGQAGLSSKIEVFSDAPNDGSTVLKISTVLQTSNTLGATPSAGTIAAIETLLTVEKPVVVGHDFEVITPLIKTIYYDIMVRFADFVTTVASKQQVRDDIRSALALLHAPRLSNSIANPEVEFGKTVRISDGLGAANSVNGVESLDEDNFFINGTLDDVTLLQREFPVLAGVIVRDINDPGNEI